MLHNIIEHAISEQTRGYSLIPAKAAPKWPSTGARAWLDSRFADS